MKTRSLPYPLLFGVFLITIVGATAAAAQTLPPQERLCDPTWENCRSDIITYIRQETVQIDMAFWMMTDARYASELIRARDRGVKIRLLMDPRCDDAHEACGPQNTQLANAGIPMRNRKTSGILHWKAIIFVGQGQMEFSGANYAPFEMTPFDPWVNYTDEIVYFTDDAPVVQSFLTKFDDLWTSTTEFANYANIPAGTVLTRDHPTFPIDPELNFPPDNSYRSRSTAAYKAETQAIDVLMFRITDESQPNAIITAVNRGIPVRLITDEIEYRNVNRLWDAYNVDKMYTAGVQVRFDSHEGINHAKGVILKSQGLSIFGSSNWTSPSTDSQREHNYFTKKAWIFQYLTNLFERKWTNGSGHIETKAFVPLPPNTAIYNAPANNAAGVATTPVTLKWNAGLWAHVYDIYFGTTPTPPLLEANRNLGPSQTTTDYKIYTVPVTLRPGTTYYWKIVSKTMASLSKDGAVWSFTTAGAALPPNNPPSVSLTAPANGAAFGAGANVTMTSTAADADGSVLRVNYFANGKWVGSSTTAPSYAATWSKAPAGSYTLTAVATDNNGATTVSGGVGIAVGNAPPPPPPPPPPAPLPAPWNNSDVGATGAVGSSSFANGTFSVRGAGADIWGTADAFQFAWQQVTGDATVVARVASVQNTNAWFKAGVMIRKSLSASAAQGTMLVSFSKGTAFQRRLSDGAASVGTSGPLVTAPRWVRLSRTGSTITASLSVDGSSWTQIGSDTFAMGPTVYVGLAVSSHVTGTPGTATFDNVNVSVATGPPNAAPTVALTSPADGTAAEAPATVTLSATAGDSDGTVSRVDFYAGTSLVGSATAEPYTFTWNGVATGTYSYTAVATDNLGATATSGAATMTVTAPPPPPLPSGWSNGDIGVVSAAGSASFSNGTFTVTGSGLDVWGTADAFHYAYQSWTGDGTIVARVATEQNVASWTKAGVMIRETLSAGSAQAFMLVSPGKGVAFQRRVSTGGISTSTGGALVQAPRWVKLTRTGTLFEAYESADGVTWTLVGSDTIAMGAQVFVGLAVSSHTTNSTATATFDNVGVQ